MGGALGVGNWSPAAEFNMVVDPEAADIVFNNGSILVNVIPLEVSHRVLITEDVFK
jgi:inosine-uridine nucleoside N-ribohydrolase